MEFLYSECLYGDVVVWLGFSWDLSLVGDGFVLLVFLFAVILDL